MREIVCSKNYAEDGRFEYVFSESASRENYNEKVVVLTPYDDCCDAYTATCVATERGYRWMLNELVVDYTSK